MRIGKQISILYICADAVRCRELKGKCHEIFASGFFMNSLPPSPENNISSASLEFVILPSVRPHETAKWMPSPLSGKV